MAETEKNLLPICRLPVEIIVHIIKHIQGRATDDENTPASEQRSPLGKAWRSFTLTCSYIRNVANSSPELWRNLENVRNKKEWIQLSAERAGSLPLSIYFSGGHSWRRAQPHLFVLHFLPRAYTALLCPGSSQGFAATVRALNHKPLTHMRFLEVKVVNSTFTIQPTFLGGATGQLERLVLQVRSGIAIHKPPEGGFPALCFLQIESLELEHGDDISRVVQWLSGAPRIEELFITMHVNDDASIATATDRFGLHIPKISLPSLRTLHLGGCLILVSSLFQVLPDPQVDLAIRIKPSSDYDVSSHWRPNSGGRHAQIHERIARFWCTHGGDLPGGALDVDPNWRHCDVFELTMSFDSGPRIQNDRELRLFYKCPVWWVIDEFDPLLGYIHTLRLSNGQIAWALRDEDYVSGFNCLPNLRLVVIEECCDYDLTHLEDWLQRRMNSNPRPPLTSIIFKNCHDDVRPMAARINNIISMEWVVEKTESP